MIHLEIRVGHPSHHVIGLRWCDLFVAEPNWPEETVIPAAALRRWLCQPGLCDMCRGRPRVMRHVVGSSVPRQSNKGRKDERSDEHLVTPPGRVFATDERARARVTGARAALARCAVKRRLDAGRHAGAPSLRTGQRAVEHSRAAHAARAVLSGSKPFEDYEVNAPFDTIGARNFNARPIGRHRTPYSHPPVQKLASTRGTARPSLPRLPEEAKSAQRAMP
jgi:hypothetical protein